MIETLANGIAMSKGFNWKVKDFLIVKYSKEVCFVAITYPEVAKVE